MATDSKSSSKKSASTPKTEAIAPEDKAEQNTPSQSTTKKSNGLKSSPRKNANMITIILLLLVTVGIYAFQKGIFDPRTLFQSSNELIGSEQITKLNLTKTPKESSSTIKLDTITSDFAEITDRVIALESELNDLKTQIYSMQDAQPEGTQIKEPKDPQDPQEESNAKAAETLALQNKISHLIKKAMSLISLEHTIVSGMPFTKPLQVLRALLAPNDDALRSGIDTLAPYAPFGIPTQTYLIKTFEAIVTLQSKEVAFEDADSILDKTKVFFKNLVTIKKAPQKKTLNSTKNTAAESNPKHPYLQDLSNALKAVRQGDMTMAIDVLETHKDLSDSRGSVENTWLDHAKAYKTAITTLEVLKNKL